MDITPLEIAYLALVAFTTATFHSVAAFSGGLLLAVFVAPVVGVKETVPVVAVALMISQATRIWVFREGVDWRIFWTIASVSIPSIVVGVMFFLELPVRAVGFLLGTLLIAMVPVRRYMEGRSIRVGANGLRAMAVPYGLLAGTSFGVGIILGPFLLGAGLAGEALVATVSALGFTVNLTKTLIFGLSPLLTRELALAGMLLGLATIPGHYAGRAIVRRTSIRVHTALIEAIILGGGCYFIWEATQA